MSNHWSNGSYMEKSMRPRKIDHVNYIIKKSKKECYNKLLSDRELTPTNHLNPYIKSDYLNDLKIQNDFLIPKNSHY